MTEAPMGVAMERTDQRCVVQFAGTWSERTLGECCFESTPDVKATSDIEPKDIEDFGYACQQIFRTVVNANGIVRKNKQ